MRFLFIIYFLLYAAFGHSQFSGLKPITTTADGVRFIAAADIDGDGLTDIVAANKFGSNITWHQNINNGTSFSDHYVTTFLNQPISVSTVDLDGDGDVDVLSLSAPDQKLVWYENLDGLGTFGSANILSNNALGAFTIISEDVDGDGDVIWGGDSSRIEWFENLDGQGNFGPAIVIDSSLPSRSLAMEDLDNDGDLDLVSTSSGAVNIWWFENLDGIGNFGTKQEIGGNGLAASRVHAADFDGDNDIDVLAVYSALDNIIWHENIDGLGTFGPEKLIDSNEDVLGITLADFDNDAAIDILSATLTSPSLKWYENVDGLGNFGKQQIIEPEFVGSKCLAVDMDNDGDIDAIRSSQNDDTIVWYENQLILSTGEAQLNTIKVHPNPADTALYITGRKMNEINYMRVTTLLGATLWESKVFKNTINSSSWSTGSYFLEIKNVSGQKRVIQVVKK